MREPTEASREEAVIRDLHLDFDAEILKRFHAEVLVPSFRPEELESLEDMSDGIIGERSGRTMASVAVAPDGEVLGGIVAEQSADTEVMLVGYIAVRHDRRGRGIARALMRRAQTEWRTDDNVSLVVGEVHDPRQWAEEEDADPIARLRFFERLGAQVLRVPFIQPALRPGNQRVRGFLLVSFYVDPGLVVTRQGGRGVPSAVLSRFVRRYYEDTEQAMPPFDSEYEWLLAEIERDEVVPLLPLGQYEAVPTAGGP